ncbi:UDP-N-acetylmuramoyl-L-alanine--D-glutamate ligase [Actinobaculum suis]|uniref:UDP-N-acetylmuramoyl-L-alanine--D-glutamate ligase n=1 Tax=Actinobaculum suis TaxID=1657 RepID=UPI00080869C2|nr:UDP-N-acetylmuramoyl-L-alanine--D-glutamate ligase [Actinobaculum suis]OCA93333.1 UDP-N-acetylmuramoylalanine--D-glutamate ligase [Actinobaculum suis]OCA94489.1 UDP-N-acetylmuramoylalanine--D-glutamate ligase [Actinobaculum suis]
MENDYDLLDTTSLHIPGAESLAGMRIAVVGLGKSGQAAASALCNTTQAQVSAWDSDISKLAAVTALPLATAGSDADAEELAEKVLRWRPDLIVPAPAIRETSPLFTLAQENGVELASEIELAWRLRACDSAGRWAPWLAVTGTNGKTTTVTMAAHILRQAGLGGTPVGNIGNPAITETIRTDNDAPRALALELSSFQLRTTNTASPHAAVCLNIDDDHLEWHGNRESYWRAKARVYHNVRRAAIYPVGDKTVQNMVDGADVVEGARAIGYTASVPQVGQLGVVDGIVVDRAFGADRWNTAIELYELADLAQLAPDAEVVPEHIVADALAATALTRALGISAQSIRAGLRSMMPGKHRIETVTVKDGVRYIDDSKATNAHAARASLLAQADGTVVWIAGGQPKGAHFTNLVREVESKLRAVVVIGTEQEEWHEALGALTIPVYYISALATAPMQEAITWAREIAQPGDTVLLAPAAASMDQFTSYADRGDAFAREARK